MYPISTEERNELESEENHVVVSERRKRSDRKKI
jgi:hypothetical protein